MGGYTRASDYIANRQTKIPSYVTSPSLSNAATPGKVMLYDDDGYPQDLFWSPWQYTPHATVNTPLFEKKGPIDLAAWVNKAIYGGFTSGELKADDLPYEYKLDQIQKYLMPAYSTASLQSGDFTVHFDYQGDDKVSVDSPYDMNINDAEFKKDGWIINTIGQASDLIFTSLDSTIRPYEAARGIGVVPTQQANYIGGVRLETGQAYNPFTGQIDNPNLHPDDAKKINRGDAYRRVSESGLSRANVESARTTSSVLASLTEQVVGSVRASPSDNGLQTTQRVTDIGLGQGGGRSILGTEKAAKKAKLKSILPTSSSF